MHFDYKWLQLFADGAADGGAGDGGASSGDTSAAAEQTTQSETQADRLARLGVPADKLKKAKYTAPVQKAPESVGQTASAAKADETAPPKRMTWKEIMEDPEYNKEMQKTMSARVKQSKQAEENMERLTPALARLASKYGVEADDVQGLIDAIEDDDEFYEDRAVELGTSVEIAKRLDRAEAMERRQQAEQERAEREAQLQEHFSKLQQQADIFKDEVPEFDLQSSLADSKFVYMTQPGSPIDVNTAYKALHFDELVGKAVQEAVNKMSASLQQGQRRPSEGARANTSAVSYNPNAMTKEQRAALVQRIKAGEKIYPGQELK